MPLNNLGSPLDGFGSPFGRSRGSGGEAAFTPASLFAGGTTAVLFDADEPGTVTLASGNVSQWNDISGKGNHASQATVGDRPLFETLNGHNYVTGDAASDHLRTGNLNLSHTDKASIWLVLRKGAISSRMVAEFGTSFSTAGSWYLSTEALAESYTVNVGGTGGRQLQNIVTPQTTDILVVTIDRSDAGSPDAWLNGVQFAVAPTAITGSVVGNFNSALPLSLLARWNGSAVSTPSLAKLNVFGMVDRLLTADEIAALYTYYQPRQ